VIVLEYSLLVIDFRISNMPLLDVQSIPVSETARDRIAKILRDAIFAGDFRPGERVVELQISKQLGVGITTVREALFEMERAGFVNRVANRGVFITTMTQQEIEQVYVVRRELEGLAAQLCARSETERAQLQHWLNEMKRAADDGDLTRFNHCDLEFHRSLWAASGNPYLADALEKMVAPMFVFYLARARPGKGVLVSSVTEHQRIIDAIGAGDPKEARRVTESILGKFRDDYRKELPHCLPAE